MFFSGCSYFLSEIESKLAESESGVLRNIKVWDSHLKFESQ